MALSKDPTITPGQNIPSDPTFISGERAALAAMPGAAREAGHKFDVVSLAPLKRRRIQDTGSRQASSGGRGGTFLARVL